MGKKEVKCWMSVFSPLALYSICMDVKTYKNWSNWIRTKYYGKSKIQGKINLFYAPQLTCKQIANLLV